MEFNNLYAFTDSNGIIVPNSSTVKADMEERFKAIFGTDLDVSSETPVGRLIEAITVLVQSSLGVTAQSANQFNVNYATGTYLDSLAQIYDISRYPGVKTTVPIVVTLTNKNVVVSTGSLIMNETGDMFSVDSDISAEYKEGDYWYGNGTATAQEYGPISGDEGTITKIQSGILGWVGVSNSAATQIGSGIESDDAFRNRIKESRPTGIGFTTHLESKLMKIEGVDSVCILENNNSVEVTKNGVYLGGHSVYVCVYCSEGEAIEKAIAKAIFTVKPAGTGMVNGLDAYCDARLVEMDVNSEKGALFKSTISFYRPIVEFISVRLTVHQNTYTGTNLTGSVKAAVVESICNVGIGDTVYGMVVASDVISKIRSISVTEIKMSNRDKTYRDVTDLPFFAYVKPMVAAEDIVVDIVS